MDTSWTQRVPWIRHGHKSGKLKKLCESKDYAQIFNMVYLIKLEKNIIYTLPNLSVIRQKGESQNGCFKKTKHAKSSLLPNSHLNVRGIKHQIANQPFGQEFLLNLNRCIILGTPRAMNFIKTRICPLNKGSHKILHIVLMMN